MALSKKDKNLIYFCALFSAAALSYMLVISPQMETLSKLEDQYEYDSMQAEEIKLRCVGYEAEKEYFEEMLKDFDKTAQGFCEIKDNESADELLTKMVLDHDLLPVSLDVSEGESFLAPYHSSVICGTSDYVASYRVSLTFNGSYDNVMALVDDMNADSGMLVQSISFSPEGEMEYGGITGAYMTAGIVVDLFVYDRDMFMEQLISEDDMGMGEEDTEDPDEENTEENEE